VKQFTVFGQHVHIGCATGDQALYLLHSLSRFVPHFIALAAGSPFYQAEPRVKQVVIGVPVMRRVDPRGDVAFAGTGYHAGVRHAGQDVEVRLIDDSVEIYLEGTLLRTHKARHDKSKEHGAFGVPQGRPRKKKAS
jgi:hypothetical protein